MKDQQRSEIQGNTDLNAMYFSIEWLNGHLQAITDPLQRITEKLHFIASAGDFLVEDCTRLADECLEEAQATGYTDGELAATLYKNYFRVFAGDRSVIGDIPAFEEKLAAREMTPMIAFVYQKLGFFYWATGQRAKAFEHTFRVLKETEDNSVVMAFGWSYYQLAVFNFDLKDYDTSLDYYLKAQKLAEQFGEVYGSARAMAGIASVYIAKGRTDEAMNYNMQAKEGFRKVGHKIAESRVLNDLGVIFAQKGDFARAEQYLREALEMRENFRYAPGIITSRTELARIHLGRNNEDEAEQLLLSALGMSVNVNSKQKAAQCHMLLSDVYRKKGEPWKALEHLQNGHQLNSEIAGEETSSQIHSLQQKYATEKADQEAEIHRLKNVELKKAYGQIEEKNKSITDSIHYARRIQRALLPSPALLGKHIPEHFVLYRPKDIVSGDFYWATETKDLFFLAACDCTGHGVPGAFMSLLNASFLNESVIEKGMTGPAAILGEVRKQVVVTLNPAGSEEETRDGMDATLAVLDKKTGTLTFACANNPLLLIRKGELTVFAPDKFPVGIYPGYERKPFTSHTLALQPGDCVYLLTDGYADQFGGVNGKKFKFAQLRRVLTEIHSLPMREQLEELGRRHDAWKAGLEQVDDILVIGFRV